MTHKTQKKDQLIRNEILAFIIDRQARQLSPRSIKFYQDELDYFTRFLSKEILYISQLTPDIIRSYLISLSSHRNPGGVHAAYRALKAFFNWYASELDDPTWRNPIRTVTPPKITKGPLPGISIPHFKSLLITCDKSFLGTRDRAILMFLLDTGVRQSELIALKRDDINLQTGAVNIRHGKGAKFRIVYLAASARRELIRYLRLVPDPPPSPYLWLTESLTPLTASGLRQLIRRRSEKAGIPCPGLHDFRRAFAVESLRNGMDLVTLSHLLGHTSTEVTRRYLHLLESDYQASHSRASPVDNL